MSDLIGADQPFGVSRKLSYKMEADRYTGRVLYGMFRTKADLSRWVPPPLKCVDPHAGFIKLYSLKRRVVGSSPAAPSFSQYHEACITVEAAPPGEPPRHYNLFMWVTHDWALYKARSVLGWPKKIADISLTDTYPGESGYDYDTEVRDFRGDVSRYGHKIISLDAQLDPGAPAQKMPAFNGFYTIRHIPSPVSADEDIRELLVISPRDGWVANDVWGTGSLSFGDAPDEELSQLGEVELTSCVLRDTGWVLPAWPATRLMTLPPLNTDMGEPRPQ